jgi:acyl-CoA oxidase
MLEESNLIQQLATAYIERVVLEKSIERSQQAESDLKTVLHKNIKLYALNILQNDLGWFIFNNIMTKEKASEVNIL